MISPGGAYTLLRAGDTPLLLTCEHASARVPEPLRVSGDDRPWLDTHWAWDIGAAALCRVLLEHLGGAAILARFSPWSVTPTARRTTTR